MVKPKKLKNNLRVHLIPYNGTEAATVLVLVRVGSRYEPLSVFGGSHFIEHMMFKGTKKRPQSVDISRELDRYGAEFNAYTGKDLTGYYVKIAGDKVEVAIELLYDMLFNSLYNAREMEREKKVIVEEIKMYEENPMMHIHDLIETAMYDGSSLGREIAGTIESVKKMKRVDVINYRDRYYVPSEMVIAIAGNIPKNAMELLSRTFGKMKNRPEPESFMPFGDLPERDTPRVMFQNKDLKQIQLALAFPAPGKGHKDTPAVNLMSYILGGSMSSRLFVEVRERRGLCYFVRASFDAYEDIGAVVINAGLDNGRLGEASKTIMKEIKKISENGVSVRELAEAKEHVEGAVKLSLEDSSNRAEFYAKQELHLKEVKTSEEKLKEIQAVRRSDITRMAREIFNMKKMSIAAIGPFKDDEALLKEVGVLT